MNATDKIAKTLDTFDTTRGLSGDAYSAFDKMSESTWNKRMYDDIVQTLLERCAALAGRETLDLSRAHVLDVGCGLGGMSVALLKRTPVFEIALLDLRDNALQKASHRISAIAPKTNITLYNADVHAIPSENDTFDLVFSRGSQRFWHDQYLAYKELRRVMKPKGIAYIGGGRGSLLFQKQRAESDDTWNPEHFGRDRQSQHRLPSFSLSDSAYRKLFELWGDRFAIYAHEGDGRWFCWQKKDNNSA
ncbi:MAG TPA: class I SAM-dependent methyltransferase [Clostridiaceae bacterium]|nr:class I SAM-dependent methyltransferase [Clostridiaceae bacterium]